MKIKILSLSVLLILANVLQAADLSLAPSGEYVIDKDHAYLTFSYSHLGLSNPILRFTGIDAELNLDNTAIEKSSVNVTIDVSTVDSALEKFNLNLKGDKFFDVTKYPTATFVSTSYKSTGDSTGKLMGNLTVKGISKPATLDVTINRAMMNPMLKKPYIGFSASGVIKRTDYGMGAGVPNVGDEVTVTIETEFAKAN